MSKTIGKPSTTGLVIGTVTNRKDDKTQTGMCQVQWSGAINQNELSNSERPWSKSIQSTHSASLKGVGKSATGYMEGSTVYGLPVGNGQEFVIIGSAYSGGKGDPDGKPEYDSDIPQPAKEQSVGQDGDAQQPKYDDKNGVVPEYKDKSVTDWAKEQGGPEQRAMKHADYDDSAGLYGGSEGPDGKNMNTIIEA